MSNTKNKYNRKTKIKRKKQNQKRNLDLDRDYSYFNDGSFISALLLGDFKQLFKNKFNKQKNNLSIKKDCLYCGKCASENIYPISEIIVNNNNKNKKHEYKYKKYWFVLRKVNDSLKEKMLFIGFTYDKTISDFASSLGYYLLFITTIPLFSAIPFSFFVDIGKHFPFIFKIELVLITLIFFVIILMNYLTCISSIKKYYNTYCCPHCGCLFMPQEYRVRLKKNTSIFVKIHMAYSRLTRRKFHNVRYVSYQVEQEMKRLRMR